MQPARRDTRVWSIGSNKLFLMKVQSETSMTGIQHLKPHICLDEAGLWLDFENFLNL